MKKIALAAAMSLAASAAFAGNVAEPEVDVVEVVEDSSSSSGALLPILGLLLIGIIVATNDSSSSESM
tara:strand:+ start:61 stop:264 length:204 start_codon:yes stop_codon:yes gene_type:complete